jgi:hypothetical protein
MKRVSCWLALFAQAVWLFGCATTAPAPVARPVVHAGVCFMARDRAALAQPVRAHEWLKLLVRLDLGRHSVVALRDCTGRVIRPPPAATLGCRAASSSELPVPTAIGQASLIMRDVGRNEQLLWVVSHRFRNGDGFGPLALTRRVADGIEVSALGTLRMRMQRINLELWRVQRELVVVASGESCSESSAAHGCQRVLHLLVHRRHALLDAPLLDTKGRCVQESPIELSHWQEQSLASGLRRSYELNSAVRHDARHIVLEERLVVRDIDPAVPTQTPREVQRVEANRFVRVMGGRLISQQHPLWSRVLPQVSVSNQPAGAR